MGRNKLAPPSTIDAVAAFLTLITFGGDYERTAHTLGVPLTELRALAEHDGWDAKLAKTRGVRRDNDIGITGRNLNRAVNYVQATRLRDLIDRCVVTLSQLPRDALLETLTIRNPKTGDRIDTSPLRDLVEAAATAQELTRIALGDDVKQTKADSARQAEDGSRTVLSVETALTAIEKLGMPSAEFVKQLNTGLS
jgi:hypothetical protein